MIYELYINERLIEGVGTVALSFAVNKMQDIASRQGEFSTEIDAPLTNSNRVAIEHCEQFNSASSLPYQVATAEIFEGGVSVIRGFARITSTSDKIKIRVFGGNADWTAQVKDAMLSDLVDISELDHVWYEADIKPRRLTDWESGLIYPNVYYGALIGEGDVFGPFDEEDFFPALYIRYLLGKLFAALGYSISGDVLSDEMLLKAVLPYCGKELLLTYDQWAGKRVEAIRAEGGGTPYNEAVFFDASDNSAQVQIDCETVAIDAYPGDTQYNNTTFIFQPSQERSWKFIVNAKVAVRFYDTATVASPQSRIVTLSVQLYRVSTGSTIASKSIFYVDTVSSQTASTSRITGAGGVPAIEDIYCEFAADLGYHEEVGVRILAVGTVAGTPNLEMYLRIQDGTTFQAEPATYDIKPGDDLNMNLFLPKMKAGDFVKDFLVRWNVMYQTDVAAKTIRFFSLDEVAGNIGNALDWTDKVDLSEPPELTYLHDGYKQSNKIIHKSDSKDLSTNKGEWGAWTFNVDTPDQGEQKIYESPYSGMSGAGYIYGYRLGYIPFRLYGELNQKIAYVVNDPTQTVYFKRNTVDPDDPSYYHTSANGIAFPEIGFNQLTAGRSTTMLSTINQSKILKILIRLNRADISQRDFSLPVWLDFTCTEHGHVSGYFFINFIEQYKPGANESTWVELVKI